MLFLTEKRISRVFNMEKICKRAKKNPRFLANLTEFRYKIQIEKIVNKISRNLKKKNILLIAGPSASGKTTSSYLLVEAFKKRNINAIVISMDDFFISRDETPELSDGSKDYDNIKALNLDLLKKCMDELVTNKSTLMPVFDFVNGVRIDNAKEIKMEGDKNVIIIEGIHAFNPKILSEKMRDRCIRVLIFVGSDFKTKLGLISHNNLRYCRRLIRDFYTRGASVMQTEQYWKNVRDAEERYITPYSYNADFCIDTVHTYEPLLYSTELKEIAKVDKDAEKYLPLLDFDVEFTKNDIGKDALVWEFLLNDNKDDK